MDDLISREELIHDLSYCAPELFFDKDYLLAKINKQPAVDAVPVVHGQWIEQRWTTEYDWGVTNHRSIVCSHCNAEINKGKKTSYCPECGAKMDGERRESNLTSLWLRTGGEVE